MKRLLPNLFFFIPLLLSCKERQSQNAFKFPRVIDTLEIARHYYSPLTLSTPLNFIEVIRSFGESANLSDTTTQEDLFIDDHFLSDTTNKTVREHKGLNLYVDNTKTVSVNRNRWKFPYFIFDEPFNETEKTKTQQYIDSLVYQAKLKVWEETNTLVKGYAVYITNPTNKKIRVEEQDARLMIIQEAKDKNGNWKPIEFWEFSDCGNSYGGIVLKPNSYIMTKIIAYKGDFETSFRLKMLNDTVVYYSQPFKGSINLSQIDTSLVEEELSPRNFFNKN